MTWYCPDWRRNISPELDIAYDGSDFDDLVTRHNCSEYNSLVTVTVDEQDEEISRSDTEEATCYQHDSPASWDEPPSITDFDYYCEDCDLVFPSEEARNEHLENTHDAIDDEPNTATPPEPLYRDGIDILNIGPNNEILTMPEDRREAIERSRDRLDRILEANGARLRNVDTPFLFVHTSLRDAMWGHSLASAHNPNEWPSFYRFRLNFLVTPSTHSRWQQ